jgi:dTDP-glucose pyrophosphorylase
MYSNELLATLKELSVSFKFLCVETLTRGPAETCLLAEKLIDNDDELVIANSDQILWWNSSQFLNSVRTDGLDGAIVTFTSSTDRNSYARIDRTGYVTEIREKKVISSIALSGIHYWRQGRDFVSSAKTMIREGKLECGEYFVGPTYNLLIQSGRKIGIYHIPEYQYNPVGIPNDLEKFREKICKDFK